MTPLTKTLLAASFVVWNPVQGATEINYWLWDSNQQPSYQACADAFEKENPDIKIKITQTGWFDYWNALNTGFVSGTAPDVFWDHLSRYPEFIDNGLLVDLAPLIARDHVPTDGYVGGLVKVLGRDGKQYGLPKNWDTIGNVYNQAILDPAGLDPHALWYLSLDPTHDGSFPPALPTLT